MIGCLCHTEISLTASAKHGPFHYRSGMNMKILLILLLLLALSSLYASQEFPQWGLPEGVKARLGKGAVSEIQYSPDGRRLAVGTNIGTWIYDTTSLRANALIAVHAGYVRSLTYSPDGSLLAIGSLDKTIRLLDSATGGNLLTLEGHTAGVINTIFSEDGAGLLSVGYDNTIRLWDTMKGEQKWSLELTGQSDHKYWGAGRVFSPDNSILAVWNYENEIDLQGHIDG